MQSKNHYYVILRFCCLEIKKKQTNLCDDFKTKIDSIQFVLLQIAFSQP